MYSRSLLSQSRLLVRLPSAPSIAAPIATTQQVRQRHHHAQPKQAGLEHLRNSYFNKGLAFTHDERHELGIHGLLAPRILSEEKQMKRFIDNFRACSNDLERYRMTMALYDRNKRLFYHIASNYIKEVMPIVYTPTIGRACSIYSQLYEAPRGLYVTINDFGKVHEVLQNWPEDDVQAIVVTDGERILGLGDLGANGMGIPVGKLALYTAIGGIPPHKTLPICLDVGTNNHRLTSDEYYIGLNQPRERGWKYQAFLDEFMEACVKRWGHNVLIQFEDFGPDNAFALLDRYRNKYLVFNDDIQGTAVAAASGILAAQRITQLPRLSDNVFVFHGAGQASTGIASLLVREMVRADKISEEEASSRIWLMDSKGLVVKHRPDKRVYRGPVVPFVKDHAPIEHLIDVVSKIKPTVLIGAGAQPGIFNEEVLLKMAELNIRPVILALSNPSAKMECTAEQAYRFTDGRAVFASGSPCLPVELDDGREMIPGQANNAYVFPGVALAACAVKAKNLPDSVFVETCRALAEQVTEADLKVGLIYPPLDQIRKSTVKIAVDLAKFMYREGLASTHHPEPKDMEAFIRHYQYKTGYPKLHGDNAQDQPKLSHFL